MIGVKSHLSVQVAKVLLGLAVGLALAELLFAVRDGGAFPHLNFYERDDQLGTRLRPNAEMKLSFSGNPVTRVHTNASGLRGADWPAPGPNDVLIVGDSQVFGLGVNDDETFSARLERRLGGGAHVLNAGVPTYGPLEYTAQVEHWIRSRKPAKVVYVLNLANDLFELERPNRERHAVWDGWAVRKETAPSSVRQFPGRSWLMSQSHAVFALRGALRGSIVDAQFVSEGTWRELVSRGNDSRAEKAPSDASVRGAITESRKLSSELAGLDVSIIDHFAQHARRDTRFVTAIRRVGGVQGDPRDIVRRGTTEEGRPTFSIAFQLLYASLALRKNDGLLLELASRARDSEFAELVRKRAELRERLAQLSEHITDPRPHNALDEILERTLAACKSVNAELLVAILPLDVQVSAAEWAKYGQTPIDLEPARGLSEDVAERAARLGVRSLDLTAALRAAEPGAFLLGDIHMTAKGHAAVANAIPAAFEGPAPRRGAFPSGRSLVPALDEWKALEPLRLDHDRCEVRSLREWVNIACANFAEDRARSVTLLHGGHGDAFASVANLDHAPIPNIGLGSEPVWGPQLIVPVLDGDRVEARLGWARHSRLVRIERKGGEAPSISLGAEEAATDALGVTPKRLLADVNFSPSNFYDPSCLERFKNQHQEAVFLRHRGYANCGLGQRQDCPEGEFDFGVLGRCVRECNAARPCAGECVAWNGRFGCLE